MFRSLIFHIFLFSLWLYILCSLFHDMSILYSHDINLYYSYLSFLLCLYVCGGRFFIMSPSYLRSNYVNAVDLEYDIEYSRSNDIGRIYVRGIGDIFWKELYYDVCIDKDCSLVTYNDFVLKNVSSVKLYDSMVHKLSRDKNLYYVHSNGKSMHICLCIVMFIIWSLSLLCIWY